MERTGSGIGTAIGAFLILLFTAGPIVLALAGSVIPDRVMFASDRGLFDEVTLENYRFIFTGELPPAYLKSGANRTMISDAARQAPRSLWNCAQIATRRAPHQPPPRNAGRLRLRALPLSGKAHHLHVPDHEPARSDDRADHADLHDAAIGRTDRLEARDHPGPRHQGASLHGAHPLGVLPKNAARAVRGGGDRRLHALPVVPEDRGADGARADGGDRASSPSCSPTRSSCSRWCYRATPTAARRRSSWRRSRATPTSPGACSNAAILIAILPTILLVSLVWRFVLADLVRGAVKG